jgi:enoyl-CoA hydratase
MSFITIDVADLVATVTFDRPPVNAVEPESVREITEAFRSLADRKDVNCAIFATTGTRAFIAGADLKARVEAGPGELPSELMDPYKGIRDAFKAIRECQVPVIAAVQAPAIGAGLVFASACDVILAAETATFGLTEINVGLLGGAAHLQRMVGTYKMRKMFFTGELVPAAELYRLGAVERVVPDEDLAGAARALALEIAAKSPIALRLAKDSANRVEHVETEEAYRIEQTYTARLLGLNDSREAMRAFLEKRNPAWTWS